MKRLVLFAAFLCTAFIAVAQGKKVETTGFPSVITNINEKLEGKVVDEVRDTATILPRFIYKLKHRESKEKMWYVPGVNQKPLDDYIAEGWRVKGKKDLHKKPFIETLFEWIKIGIPIWKEVFPQKANMNNQSH